MRAGICLVSMLLVLPFVEASGGGAPGEDRQAGRGSLLYRIHCQSCHGDDGRGHGPMAEILTIRPTDLTTIAAHNDGDFPADRIRQAIDGRREVRAHGRREMPVWGLTLQQGDRDSAQEDEIRARIDDLVAHVRSLQRTGR